MTLADSRNNRGGAWSPDGVILFSPDSSGGLKKVTAIGGSSHRCDDDRSGRNGPLAADVPSGWTAFSVRLGDEVESGRFDLPGITRLERSHGDHQRTGGGERDLLGGTRALPARVHAHGAAVGPGPARDHRRCSADRRADSDAGLADYPYAMLSASSNGTLVFQSGAATGALPRLVWYDRGGVQTPGPGDLADMGDVELSPDASQVAVNILDPAQRGRDIWILDVKSNARTRLTFDPADDVSPVWSPDGKRIVFSSARQGHLDLYQKDSSGAGSEELIVRRRASEDSSALFTGWPPCAVRLTVARKRQ